MRVASLTAKTLVVIGIVFSLGVGSVSATRAAENISLRSTRINFVP
jgi:hypothetical protein